MQNSTQSENKLRWWDILAAILLFLCLFIATLRLLSTRWTSNLSLVQSIAFLGAILGLALGQSIFSRKVSLLFSVAYGVIIIPWRLGLLMDAEIGWVERLVSLWGRLVNIIHALLTKEPVTDSLLFLLLMSCLFWVLSVHAGFVITRYAHPWKAVLPTGVAILIIHSFDPLLPSRSWFVAIFLFFALLLIARLVYLRKRQQWKQTNIHTPSDVSFDFSRIAVAATIILVLFAWNVPVLAGSLGPVSKVWVDITRPWRSLKERFEFAFASLRASVGMVTDLYGDSMTLGTGTPLGDKVVLEVEAPNITLEGIRFFWRARVYDIYEDGRWQSSYAIKQVITPNSSDLYVPGYESREDIPLSIQVQDSVSLLYTASQPLWVSRPATALVIDNSDGTVDVGALSVNEYIRPGEVYETRSAVSAVTIKELREAGTEYPQWILDRYLQLPENLTPRTHELARSIAEGYETPYDIANAVTEYLRENITYKPVINKAPAGREAIDWFLFDLKEGYCNYYASSEVILLRSLGIPARLAVGFSQGERLLPTIPGHDEGLEGIPLAEWVVSYVVRQKNAHAWPEVFFPEIGWVEFEPTSSQDALTRLSGEEYPLNPSDYSPEDRDRYLSGELLDEEKFPEVDVPPEVSNTEGFWTPKSIIVMLLGLLLFVMLFFVIRRVKRNPQINPALERWATQIPRQIEKSLLRLGITPPRLISHWAAYLSLPRISRAYLEINKALKRLSESPDLYDTPTERVRQLCDVLPGSKDAALHLLNEYQIAMYSLHHADEDIAYQAGKEIRRLSLRVKLNKWLERFREPSPSASLE